jgi:DNA polymerase-1
MYVVVSSAQGSQSSQSPARQPSQNAGRGSSVVLTPLDAAGLANGPVETVSLDSLASAVAGLEAAAHPRWVWDDSAHWYPLLLAAGVRIERAVDLRLSHAILRRSSLSNNSALAAAAPSSWDGPRALAPRQRQETTLFDFDEGPVDVAATLDALAEFRLQRAAITASADPSRLGLLLAAESAGGLIAAEMQFAGLPWNAERHDELLTSVLGARPAPGVRPAQMEALLERLRHALGDPDANPDSPQELVKALRRAGIQTESTRSWELKNIAHPAIEPLLAYKKLSRLLTANGWNWIDAWVKEGRFHATFVPGGVVTGRWAADGGGALQLPHAVRGAVIADPGWKLVVADAAQLEPRILAALSGDRAMAAAGRDQDLYNGIVASGAVDTRAHAKLGMLGAMYGGTSGESGRMLPRLAKAYPHAIRFVEDAARAGERGEIVSTRLGRSSPAPSDAWLDGQAEASGDGSEPARRRAQTEARSWGRFTRNFVVQGTAAEWALCWMAGLRGRLSELAGPGALLRDGPHLAFFLHDEIMVHTPAELADDVARIVRETAAEAGRLIFGDAPVQFPVTVAIVDSYDQAKD